MLKDAHTAASVEPLSGLKLKVTFNENNRTVIYDVHRLIEQYPKYFKKLENNQELFNKAHLSAGGYAVVWNSELDVSTYDIWEHGKGLNKLVLAWDPDFTKTTPEEQERIKQAENSGFIDEFDIDWDKIGIDE